MDGGALAVLFGGLVLILGLKPGWAHKRLTGYWTHIWDKHTSERLYCPCGKSRLKRWI